MLSYSKGNFACLDLSDAHIAWQDEKGLVGSTPDVILKAVVEVQTTCQPTAAAG